MISEQERRVMASDGLLKKPETRSHCLKSEAPDWPAAAGYYLWYRGAFLACAILSLE